MAGPSRSWKRFARDWFPVAMILVAYVLLHAVGEPLSRVAHVQPQLGFDEGILGGTAPTVRLQRALWNGVPRWWDYGVWLVYLSHFVVSITVAVVLWCVAYPSFRRFRTLMVSLTFAGFVTYVLYPAIPPWLASSRGDMPATVRIVKEVWRHLGHPGIAAVFGAKSDYAFPVGALPSLHAAWPFMLALFFWPRAGRWRALLVAYVLAMAFTLVYTADHFVFDIALGWTYATVTYVVVTRVGARRAGDRERSPAEAVAA